MIKPTPTENSLRLRKGDFANLAQALDYAAGGDTGFNFYNGSGKGALTLWPLFGATNQLLAGLALLVVSIYLARKKVSMVYTGIPMVFMIFMTAWAMILNIQKFYNTSNWLLLCIGLVVLMLEIWMIIESIIVLKAHYGEEMVPAS